MSGKKTIPALIDEAYPGLCIGVPIGVSGDGLYDFIRAELSECEPHDYNEAVRLLKRVQDDVQQVTNHVLVHADKEA